MDGQHDETWIHREVDLSDFRMHFVEQGEGPLVVLLHGFPEYWRSWRLQIPALAEAGYRVVAPDMRGYNLSGKPKGVGSYRGRKLAQDVSELISACDAERAIVVGHDWGAVVAWLFAMYHPEQLDRLGILNVPHPMRMLQGFRTLRQLRKSWYVFFFQIPGLPEAMIRRKDHAMLWRTFRTEPTLRGVMSDEDIQGYVDAMAQPGTLEAAVNYYRAALRYPNLRDMHRIEKEVLVIWGEQDLYLGAELAAPDPKWVPNARVERIPEASHWVHLDAADQVNRLLIDFLAATSP